MSCMYSATEVVLIIGGISGGLAGIIVSMKNFHSKCCGGEIDFEKADGSLITPPTLTPQSVTVSPSPTVDVGWISRS